MLPVVDDVEADPRLTQAVAGFVVESGIKEHRARTQTQARRRVVLEEAADDRAWLEIIVGHKEAGFASNCHGASGWHAALGLANGRASDKQRRRDPTIFTRRMRYLCCWPPLPHLFLWTPPRGRSSNSSAWPGQRVRPSGSSGVRRLTGRCAALVRRRDGLNFLGFFNDATRLHSWPVVSRLKEISLAPTSYSLTLIAGKVQTAEAGSAGRPDECGDSAAPPRRRTSECLSTCGEPAASADSCERDRLLGGRRMLRVGLCKVAPGSRVQPEVESCLGLNLPGSRQVQGQSMRRAPFSALTSDQSLDGPADEAPWSRCSPILPKHQATRGSWNVQRPARGNTMPNPAKSAKPPSPVQIRAAPPFS